ncbi:hypothetical protein SDC9_169828 [bioreactor metagenome]|uniref:Uncharacterized protein n=1 Tax=bioreactor metagenome TaxID=1076179 RepID=A0A645G722_9ZZZZ
MSDVFNSFPRLSFDPSISNNQKSIQVDCEILERLPFDKIDWVMTTRSGSIDSTWVAMSNFFRNLNIA